MEVAIPIVFFLVVFVAIVGFALARRRRANRIWSQFADRHGLDFFKPGWFGEYSMSGVIDGVDVTVKTETRGSGKSKSQYTLYQASLPDGVPFDLVVYNEGFLSKVGKFFGGQDIEVGDAGIDEAFIIKSDHPEEVDEFFEIDDVRAVFRRLAQVSPQVRVDHGVVQLEHRGLLSDADRLEDNVETLLDVSGRLDEAISSASEAASAAPQASGKSAEANATAESGAGSSESAEEQEEFVAEW